MSRTGRTDRYRLRLRAGDWVVVRPKDEILATLDSSGRFDGMPFQPEMFSYCGRRLRVHKVAHKTCDTIHKTGGRRLYDTVHLEGARCDGSLHGGCQADCIFFWKEAWLRRDGDDAPSALAEHGARCTEDQVLRATRAPGQEHDPDPDWVCQTTALFDASEPLPWWDLRQYMRDVTSGNHSVVHIAHLLLFASYRQLFRLGVGYRALLAVYNGFQKVRGGKPYPVASGTIPRGEPTPNETLDLQPGEWVQIKSTEEVGATINSAGFNRGMRFDQEMVKYCGGRYRVQMRVERLIDERTGKMLVMKSPCIQLEDVYCRAECTGKRLGCPREMNTYWREIWLRRAPPAGGPGAHTMLDEQASSMQ